MDLRRWCEVQASFDGLLELDEVQRAVRLVALSSSDPELHAAVEALFAGDADVDARLAWLEAAPVSQSARMTDLFGLVGRRIAHYEVLEPIGAGGMGVVYRGRDTRLGRDVALKFLLPSYNYDAAAKARFLREAHAAAALDHPNLCTIYDVGASDDRWLFIAMALYDGETLRTRLDRDGTLPICEAEDLAHQIAEGLRAAHAAGIVHRDLKPGNVMLLPNGSVRILDFGLAKARDQDISNSGQRFGTLSYMSPEQIVGNTVSARTDLWALGIVLYEALTGRRPFSADQEVGVIHAILHDQPQSLSTHRADIPSAIDALVMQLLQKDPAARPQSAGEVVQSLAAASTPGRRPHRALTAITRWRHQLSLPLALMSAAVLSLVAIAAMWRWPHDLPGDERLVAVMPFHVAGADSSLDYLREGIIDLLSAKLTGNTRVADARSVLAAWHAAGGTESQRLDPDRAMGVGAKLGAREVLLGSITGAGGHVTFRATLVPVKGGAPREAMIEGPQDSIFTLVEKLAIQLLALRAGEDIAALGDIAATPFTAIRDYLEAQQLARRGQSRLAYDRYRAAASADSNFGAAWFGMLDIAMWDAGATPPDTASRQLARLRGRLTPTLQAMVDARIGLHYPVLLTLGERYRFAERAAQVAHDDPRTWQYLGEVLFHWGAAAGVENAPQRAIAAFERALALDSSLRTAVEHLPWLYYERGDTASLRRWLAQSLASDSSGGNANLYLADVVLGDAKRGAQWRTGLRDRFGAIEVFTFLAADLALPMRPIDSALTAFISRAVTEPELRWSTWRAAGLAHLRGQPRRAATLLGTLPGMLRDDWPTHILVLESAFGDVDSTLGERARRALDASLTTDCVLPFTCPSFAAAVYDIMHGKPETARAVLQRFRTIHPACWPEAPSMCAGFALVLDAMLAANEERPDARIRLIQLDSMLRDAPVQIGPLLQAGNLVAARLWEKSGDRRRALAAVRRRVRFLGVPEFQATYLREEGRLAAAVGDRAGAIRAYRGYLTLRDDAEPSLQRQLDRARDELARLEGRGSTQ